MPPYRTIESLYSKPTAERVAARLRAAGFSPRVEPRAGAAMPSYAGPPALVATYDVKLPPEQYPGARRVLAREEARRVRSWEGFGGYESCKSFIWWGVLEVAAVILGLLRWVIV